MNKFDCDWVSPENMRSDMHPLAVLDSENPITECVACGLPVPEEANGDIYCNKACQDAQISEAILNDAALDSFFTEMVVELPASICSCH